MEQTKSIKGRKHYKFVCKSCSNVFYRRSDRVKTTNTNYCVDCIRTFYGKKNVAKLNKKKTKTGEYHKCDWCGVSVYVQPAKQRWRNKTNQKHNFCDRECYLNWYRKNFNNVNLIKSVDNVGNKNGHYKHGKRIGRGGDSKRKLKEEIIIRDGNGCLLCETENYLHVHRIIPGSEGGKYNLNNTVILCRDHHALIHADINKWKRVFADYTAEGREWRKQKREELKMLYQEKEYKNPE